MRWAWNHRGTIIKPCPIKALWKFCHGLLTAVRKNKFKMLKQGVNLEEV